MRLLKYWWITFLLAFGAAIVAPCISGDVSKLHFYQVLADLDAFDTALARRHAGTGKFPHAEKGLNDLVPMELRRVPTDPWGNPYLYVISDGGDGPQVYSVGANGVDERGTGDDVTGQSKEYSCEQYGVNCEFTALAIAGHLIALLGLLSLLVGIVRGVRYLIGYARPE